MCDPSPRRWHRWRVTLIATNPARRPAPVGSAERPGPDGIRHDLVARIRREIAEGRYDTEEKWLAAEEALLRRIEGRR
jgi:anti-sigma28 factor (negative regulator of flagellin synthesis)